MKPLDYGTVAGWIRSAQKVLRMRNMEIARYTGLGNSTLAVWLMKAKKRKKETFCPNKRTCAGLVRLLALARLAIEIEFDSLRETRLELPPHVIAMAKAVDSPDAGTKEAEEFRKLMYPREEWKKR